MLAAVGLWRLIVAVHARAETDASAEAGRQALVLLAVGIAVLMTEPLRYVLPRSDDGIAIARFIAANGPRDGVLAEPAWNLGGRIYLPLVSPLVDVDPSEMSDRTRIVELIGTPQLKWVVFQERDLRRMDYDDAIRAAGFVEVFVTQGDSRFRVYRRP
jgi:hypothetical protein